MADALYGIWGSTLTGIANSIRTKNPNVSGLVDPADMEQDILDIPSGGEPYIPKKQIISHINFCYTGSALTGLSDDVRSFTFPTANYTAVAWDANGTRATGRGAYIYPAITFNAGMNYEVILEIGANSETTFSNQYNQVLRLSRGDNHFTLTYDTNASYGEGTGRWRVSDQSGNNKWLTNGNGDPHYLDNKTLKICYGFKYVNGEAVLNTSRISWYVNDALELEGTERLITNGSTTAQLAMFVNNAMIGFTFKEMTVYQWSMDLQNHDIYTPASFNIVESLPSTLTNEAIYLIPNGGQIFPDLTTVCSYLPDPSPSVSLMHYVVVTCDYTYTSYQTDRVTLADLANITKFWLFDGERTRASTRYNIGEDITYGSSNRQTPPSIVYEYDTEHPELGWVDISSEVTQAAWEAGTRPRHTTPTIVFSNFDIFRNSAGTEMYTQRYSICDKHGKAIRIGDVTTYDIYYVDNSVAVLKGTQKTILELYQMLINGQITPSPVNS